MSTTEQKLAEALEAQEKLATFIKTLKRDAELERRNSVEAAMQEKLNSLNALCDYAKYTLYPDMYFRRSTKYRDKFKLILEKGFKSNGLYTDGPSGSMIVALLKRIAFTHEFLMKEPHFFDPNSALIHYLNHKERNGQFE